MRIISGTCRGRKLATLKGMSIRPTSDRVRESIFNIIAQSVYGADVLDLFAGTGAFGLECLSRGASMTLFVDISRDSCSVIRNNIELCKFTSNAVVLQYDALKLNLPENIISKQVHTGINQVDNHKQLLCPFNLIFLDPPYEMGFVEKTLKNSALLHYVGEDSLMIVEHSFKEKIPDDLQMVDIQDQRQYGKTLVSFLKLRC